MTGVLSSDVAVKRFVELVGSHAIELTGLRLLFRVSEAFLVFKSHTVTKPPALPVARMLETFRFQATQSMSWAAAVPRRKAVEVSLMSQTNSSPFAPAVASTCGLSGLNCRALIGPVCLTSRERRASSPARSFAASHSWSEPSSIAPATTPRGWSSLGAPHAIS